MSLASPFQCGGSVKSFPPVKCGQTLTIRIDDTASGRVYIKINGTPSSSNADYLLLANEAVDIPAISTNDQSVISIINDVAADPKIYWSLR